MKAYPIPCKPAIIRTSVLVSALFASAAFLQAQPTTNPVTDSGIDVGAYDTSWIDALPWSTVTTTAATADDGTYNADGTIASGDDLATVQAEIFALSGSGGGVLYFPAGTYDFSDTLYMADGVILRGATPAVGDCRGIDDGATIKTWTLFYDPTTNFKFPVFIQDFTTSMRTTDANRAKYFKQINVGKSDGLGGVLKDATDASNYGIVNIDIEGAVISIGDRNEPSTWGTEIPKNEVTAKNILVFGNRINNGTVLEPSIPKTSQNAWQIWPTRTRGKIDAVTAGNTLIANNLIGDKHYKYYVLGDTGQTIIDYDVPLGLSGQPTTLQYLQGNTAGDPIPAIEETVHFSDAYGVRLNHVLDYVTAHSAVQEPSKHREGQGIINNWQFGTTRVGFMGAGNGLIVKGNVREDFQATKWEIIHEDGSKDYIPLGAAPTIENRGIDITGGHDVIVEDNYVRVQRGSFYGTPYQSTDGEGLLAQESSGTMHAWNWTIRNNTTHSYLGIYRLRHANGILFDNNTVYGDSIYTDGSVNGSQGHVGGTVSFKDNTATSIFAKYTIKPRNLVVDDQGGNSPAVTVIESGNDGVTGVVDVDAIPGVEILYPTKADMASISAGSTITVQVKVTRDAADTTAVSGVKVWDGITNYPANGQMSGSYWTFDGLTAGQPAGVDLTLVTPDGTTGAIGGGIYEGSWTVPAEFDLRGLLMAEVRLDPQTGVTGDWTEKAWAFIEDGSGTPIVVPVGVTAAISGSDVQIGFETEPGQTYQLLKSTDNMATWPPILGQSVVGDGTSKVLTDTGGKPASGAKVFYKIEVTN
jgi:hypothetical protein